MAKDVKKTQKKNVVKEDDKNIKKGNKTKKETIKEKKVVEEKVDTKKETKEVIVKKKERNNKKLLAAVKTVDDNRKVILFGIVGFLLATLLFRCILWPDRIATLSDGTQPIVTIDGNTITADDLYENMKERYSIDVLLNDIDDMILSKMYPEDSDMKAAINKTAEYYYSTYESYYGYTKADFLTQYGFASEDEFIESLKLDYRRNLYYEEYVSSLVTDSEINKYYEDEVFGDVDSKHILVKIDEKSDEGLTDSEAKKLAEEIIKKLNSGKTWNEVVEEYKNQIVHEELGYNAFNASLESAYLEECKNLEVGKYSEGPVLTSYGYHIVYKVNQKDKPSLNDVKDDIIEILAEKMKSKDTDLYYKSLIALREEKSLEFSDTKLGEEYKKYINEYK